MAYTISSVKENLQNIMIDQPERGAKILENCIDLQPITEDFLKYIFHFLCKNNKNSPSILSYKEYKGLPKNTEMSHRSYYFPSNIQDSIVNSDSVTYNYLFNVRDREVSVDLVNFKNDDDKEDRSSIHTDMINLIYNWLLLATYKLPPLCSKTLHIYIYLTDFNKNLPVLADEMLNVRNVNSAYTTSCDIDTEIVIYRKEEWFKVFIHETFHCLGMDFSHREFDHDSYLNAQFPFKNINYKVFESYCETWARIMNTCFTAFSLLPKMSKEFTDMNFMEYSSYFSFCMYYESLFSAKQMWKVLRHYNIKYEDIINKQRTTESIANYKESTSVISYYIFSSILINNFQTFIKWCSQTHKKEYNIFKFHDTNTNIISFCNLISSLSTSDKVIILQSIFSNNKYEPKHDTLLMTYIPGPTHSPIDIII